jgi:hypothetical protein
MAPAAASRFAIMDQSAETARTRRPGADRTFRWLAGISLLLVALIAADGVRKGLDTIVPGYYRHFASLSIAISELAHGTSGLVGLVEVDKALDASGYSLDPGHDRLGFLNTHPAEADAALRAAADLAITDRSKTFGLMQNETGMIDYYYLAFKIFGYHVRSIYALYMGILTLIALCFIGVFRQRAMFIVPSIVYLLLLFADQHGLNPVDYGLGPLTNSRLLPLLSLYPVLFCLTLMGSGRRFHWADAIAVAFAGLVFALVVNARTYALWQIGPLIALPPLIVASRILPWRWPLKTGLARLSIYPALVFAICTAAAIEVHHWRRDASVYDTATFIGHEYWLTYAVSTMAEFRWRIPELERESGITINEGDSYGGALLRIKIKERGESLDDYLTRNGQWWNEIKREDVARQVVFDLWRNYPREMIANYGRAFTPIGVGFLKDLGWLALAVAAISIGAHTALAWLLRAVAMVAIGGFPGATALAAAGLRFISPTARRLSNIAIPIACLALCVIPAVLAMPFTNSGKVFSVVASADPRMSDLNDVVWLCLLILVCGAGLPLAGTLRFRHNAASKQRAAPRDIEAANSGAAGATLQTDR